MIKPNPVALLFATRTFVILSDSSDFLLRCKQLGFLTLKLEGRRRELPACCIAFSFTYEAAQQIFEQAETTTRKKCIFCPIHVFEPSVESALYALNLILKSDFGDALETQEKTLNTLNIHKQLHLMGRNSLASVVLREDSIPYGMVQADMTENFITSIAEFFEVHYAHTQKKQPCPFTFEGTLEVSGILLARRKNSPTHLDQIKPALDKLKKSIGTHPAKISIQNNIVTSLISADGERVDILARAAGSGPLQLTEFAIGVNKAIAPMVDFCMNSQLNEGIEGIHIAVGDGSSGYHIDFLSPGVTAVPV